MLIWEVPEGFSAGRSSGGGRWHRVAEELKSRPGEWALVAEGEWVSSVRALVGYGCEVTARGSNRPRVGMAERIYARFVGVDDVEF